MPHLDQETIDIFKFLKTRLPGWRTMVKKESQVSMWKRYVKECNKGLKPEDLPNLTTSKPAIEAWSAHKSVDSHPRKKEVLLLSARFGKRAKT